MGEVTNQTRIYTLPFMEQAIKIENKFEYDSWGRINKLTYPDGEVVKYEYDHSGLLKRMMGTKEGQNYTYLSNIEYDKFGAKTKEQYGNGLFIDYGYNAQNLRLTTQETYRLIYEDQYQQYTTPVKQSYVNTSYGYDATGNITQMNTTYSRTYPQTFNQTFTYDDANQLTQASGNTDSIYNLNINYGNYGRINTYNTSLTDPQTNIVQQQDNNFTYPTVDIPSTAFAPKANNDSILYRYGINGSLRSKGNEYYLFNAFDQMKAYSDNGESYGYYGYDDKGERIYKLQLNTVSSNTNIYPNVKYLEVEKLMFYPNGYININQNGEYTKHYYADATRIASKIGSGFNESLSDTTAQNGDVLATMKRELGEVVIPHDTIAQILYDTAIWQENDSVVYENGLFFYHGDHLSSSQMITDINAGITQQILYAPFGEVITEYNAYWHQGKTPDYMFNAKELDEENGMYYYEARYYNPPTFISRDPLFEKYPALSPYSYTANNPLKYIDPTGMEAELGDYYGINGKWLGSDGKNDNKAYTAISRNSDGTFNNAQELPISNSELLDRSTWVHGESGGSGDVITNRTQNAGDASTVSDARVADYYANAINNAANSDGGFYKAVTGRMGKMINGKYTRTSEGYFQGKGIGGNANSKAFANARNGGMESLMNVPGAQISISAVISSVTGGSDPTGGARAWLGSGEAVKYVNNSSKVFTFPNGSNASFQFSFPSKGGRFNHTFYRK
jgi:RHS repeat-associated protein